MVILWHLLSEAEDLQASAALLSPQQFDLSLPTAFLTVAGFRPGYWQLLPCVTGDRNMRQELDLAVGKPSGFQR